MIYFVYHLVILKIVEEEEEEEGGTGERTEGRTAAQSKERKREDYPIRIRSEEGKEGEWRAGGKRGNEFLTRDPCTPSPILHIFRWFSTGFLMNLDQETIPNDPLVLSSSIPNQIL